MSYILDALKKSDQQRQHAKAPTLLSAQNTLDAPKRSTFASNTGLALVLIGAGILIGWLQPWRPSIDTPELLTASPQTTTAGMAANSTEPSKTATKNENTSPPSGVIATTKSNAVVPPPAATPDRIAMDVAANRPTPAKPVNDSQPDPLTEKPVLSTGINPPADEPENRVLTPSELPAAIRQQLPSITIAFHQYSSAPIERRVMINNAVLRQGDFIAPGLKLEKITPEGVIISYMGYQFLRGVR